MIQEGLMMMGQMMMGQMMMDQMMKMIVMMTKGEMMRRIQKVKKKRK